MGRTPERRRRGRGQAERRRIRRDDERRWALRNQAATAAGRAHPEPEKSDASRPSARHSTDRALDIIERHRENHPTKVRTITGKRSAS